MPRSEATGTGAAVAVRCGAAWSDGVGRVLAGDGDRARKAATPRGGADDSTERCHEAMGFLFVRCFTRAVEASGLLVVGACLLAGRYLQRDRRLTSEAPRALGTFVLLVPLPALVIVKMHALLAHPAALGAAWLPISMAWLQIGFALLLGRALRRPLGLSTSSEGALVLSVGLGNTAFVGYPLVEALLGPEAMPFAVLADQPGSFAVLSTVGALVAAAYGARRRAEQRAAGSPGVAAEAAGGTRSGLGAVVRAALRRALAFPPMIALLIACATAPLPLPEALIHALDKLAASLVPASLVAVGLQLRLDPATLRRRGRLLAVGLLAKLVVVPLVLAGLYIAVLGQRGLVVQTTLLQAAMAPMVTGALLVEEAGLDGELASGLVGVGVLLSLLTVSLWSLLLAGV
jgi:malate permease and related proteins